MSYFHQDSIFWIEVDKIRPNPFQPRREFNEEELQSLANSIRQYGVLQALVVTRQEILKDDGGLSVEYELISGERRLRASKLAGVKEVPVLIRSGEENDLMKLELAIIENLQREDLNVVERARAFEKLAEKFSLSKAEVARKVGKSREYVSNTMRVLSLPKDILDALSSGKISEGHARPLLMLVDHPEEQNTLFKEILYKKISVREAERIAKKVAKERIRKPGVIKPEIEELEKEFTNSLGTRVNIVAKEVGGKISIDYFSEEDLHSLLEILKLYKKEGKAPMLENFLNKAEQSEKQDQSDDLEASSEEPVSSENESVVIEEETVSYAEESVAFERGSFSPEVSGEVKQEDQEPDLSNDLNNALDNLPEEPENEDRDHSYQNTENFKDETTSAASYIDPERESSGTEYVAPLNTEFGTEKDRDEVSEKRPEGEPIRPVANSTEDLLKEEHLNDHKEPEPAGTYTPDQPEVDETLNRQQDESFTDTFTGSEYQEKDPTDTALTEEWPKEEAVANSYTEPDEKKTDDVEQENPLDGAADLENPPEIKEKEENTEKDDPDNDDLYSVRNFTI
ncbi:MAG: ParB/RepB/Spo0J family partition protein [Candidatus Paceibacterota bacterium]